MYVKSISIPKQTFNDSKVVAIPNRTQNAKEVLNPAPSSRQKCNIPYERLLLVADLLK
jgi:hypothetical protein